MKSILKDRASVTIILVAIVIAVEILRRFAGGGAAPDGFESYVDQGNWYNEHEQYEEAVDAFSQALSQNPQDAVTLNNRCLSYNNLERYEEAVEDCNRALAIDPTMESAYV